MSAITVNKEQNFSNITPSYKEDWTNEKVIDELIFCLCNSNTYIIDQESGHIQITHKYYEQAQSLLYRIPLGKPTPPFVICLNDLDPKIIYELEQLQRSDPLTLIYVLKMAVGAIFENIHSEYYHRSVARNLKIKFSGCNKK